MNLVAIYNTFDGEELLAGSIAQIYDAVDEILIIYQYQSNYGNRNNHLTLTLLEVAQQFPKVRMHLYSPDFTISAPKNEKKKRNFGLWQAKRLGCTHFLLMDNDEFYMPEQFTWARNQIEENGYDATACRLYTYYKDPTFQLSTMEEYWVPFICELKSDTKVGTKFPVRADPTRGCAPIDNFYAFDIDDLTMHHYSYVRKDIASKLYNSSARKNFKNIPQLIQQFEDWEMGQPLINFSNNCVTQVPNYFNINLHGYHYTTD